MGETTARFLEYVNPSLRRLALVARQYAGIEEDRRDLVQETLLRAWKGYSPTEERTYSRAWLFVIMRNVVLDWQRAANRRIKLVPTSDSELTDIAHPDVTEPFAAFPNMDEAGFRELLDDRIVASLDELAPAFREVLIMSVTGGLNYREIGEVLDCPVGTVMSRMARARRMLRQRLADYAHRQCRHEEVRP